MATFDKVEFQQPYYQPHVDFWKSHFGQFPPQFIFSGGADFGESKILKETIRIDGDELDKTLSVVNNSDHGLFVYFTACLAVLLKRYMRNNQLIIHVPSTLANSDMSVPLLLALGEGRTFREHLNTVRRTINESYKFQEYPVELLKDHGHPVYNSNVLFKSESIHPGHIDVSAYSLIVTLKRTPACLLIEITYNTSILGKTMLRTLQQQIYEMLPSRCNLDARLSSLTFLPETEVQSLIALGEGVSRQIPNRTLSNLFEQTALLHESRTAVVYNNATVTYKDLDKRASRLASHLLHHCSVKTGDFVGIMADRTDRTIVSILAILKAGAAYVPIDPKLPIHRINYIIDDSKIGTLITDSNYMFSLNRTDLTLVALDIQEDHLESSVLPTDFKLDPALPAYIIYTSGTSGKPKGVVVSHRSILNTVLDHIHTFSVSPSDRILQFASLSFDASVLDIFVALLSGAAVVMVDHDVIKDGPALVPYMREKAVTVATLPPSYLNSVNYLDLSFLRVLITAGERAIAADAFHFSKQTNYFNAYGPTECAVALTVFKYPPSANILYKATVPIGRPTQNMNVVVLDENDNLAPRGVEGELCAHGIGVSLGYLNNESLFQSKLVRHPLLEGVQLYRTGDIVRWLENGNLDFIARKDKQLKVRGYRIEPEEIEHTLKLNPAVKNAVVCNLNDASLPQSLTALIKIDPSVAPVLSKVVAHKYRHPDYKTYVLPNGLTIFHKNEGETKLIFKEIFEEHQYEKFGIQIQPGDVIFDVGANIGMFSLYAALKDPSVKVYAMEPILEVFDVLMANIELYNASISALNVGISTFEGAAHFDYYPDNTAMSGMYADHSEEINVVKGYVKNQLASSHQNQNLYDADLDEMISSRLTARKVQCQITTLSDVIRKTGVAKIDLLKIDVEKSELDVLHSIEDQDWNKIMRIALEFHAHGSMLDDIQSLLSLKGFICTIDQSSSLSGSHIFNLYACRATAANDNAFAQSTELNVDRELHSIEPFIQSLKSLCEKSLPSYMVPQRIEVLDDIPLTINGKVSINEVIEKLSNTLRAVSQQEAVTDNEHLLLKIWKSVLGTENIGTADDFFQSGGDSIKAIQIASRLSNEGYKLDIGKIFEYPTVTACAPFVEPVTVVADQGPVEGEVPLTPIQLELFTPERCDPHHFNQAILLHSARSISKSDVEQVVRHLQNHHDALRITLTLEKDKWKQTNQGCDHALSVNEYDLRNHIDAETMFQTLASQEQRSIDLTHGPLMRVALFHLNDGDHLLFVIHHMVVDAVSWRILLEDISQLFAQLQTNSVLNLPRKTDAFKRWSEALRNYAQSPDFDSHAEYWKGISASWSGVPQIKTDMSDGSNLVADATWESFELNAALTEKLLTNVHKAYNTEINDVLLTALARSIASIFDHQQVVIELEGHGREPVVQDVIITRTVGWFTCSYPVVLNLAKELDIIAHLIEVKETLRRIPAKGATYGAFKHFRTASSARISPQIGFNYLGQFDSDISRIDFTFSGKDIGSPQSDRSQRIHAIGITGIISDGKLRINVEYSNKQFTATTIKKLTAEYDRNLQTLIKFCSEKTDVVVTPGDLTYNSLTMEDLSQIASLLD